MGRRSRSLTLATLVVVMVVGAACGAISGPVCLLSDYTADIQEELDALTALDPALVAQSGTAENAAALAAVESLEATVAAAQEALDAASDDEVGGVVRAAFQAVLDTTSTAAADMRTAIESGDANEVADAQEGVQLASDAIGAFQGTVDGLGIECPGASPRPPRAAACAIGEPGAIGRADTGRNPDSGSHAGTAHRDARASGDAGARGDA